MSKKVDESPLLLRATALDDEMKERDRLLQTLEKAPLRSVQDLQRAKATIERIMGAQSRLGEALALMGEELNALSERQLAQDRQLRDRASTVAARAETLHALLERLTALGAAAGAINADLVPPEGVELRAHAAAIVPTLGPKIQNLSDEAGALREAAKTESFQDVEREAESLRQTLVTLKGRVKLLTPTLDRLN